MIYRRRSTIVCLLAVLIATGSVTALVRADEPAPTADPMLGKEAGDVRDDNGLKMKLVWCPPGALKMGRVFTVKLNGKVEDVDTTANVLITRGYWLGKYEVTQAEWRQVMATQPWKEQSSVKMGDAFPVECTWDDAMKFCSVLTERERNAGRLSTGWEFTLPTEAQWERACRARTMTKFSFGDDASQLGKYAWFNENADNIVGERYAHRIGQKAPNPWGFHDMHGNAWEWCRDYYDERLPGGRDPERTEPSSFRVIRGGNWQGYAQDCDSANREQGPELSFSGFRIALTPFRPAAAASEPRP